MSGGIELDRYDDRNLHRLGGSAFRSKPDPHDETKYDQLRQRARDEIEARKRCKQEADRLYHVDRDEAARLREEARRHGSLADDYNKQASDLIFALNNNGNNQETDTIDLHGQFVVEAEAILRERIRADQSMGKTHLHVIVGRGNHSADHIQRLKPAVEQLCQELGLQYATEENDGRVYVNLQGDEVTHMPALPPSSAAHYGYSNAGYQQPQQQYYPGQQQQQQYHGEQQPQEDEIEKLVKKLFKKFCCTVM
ncbi:DUF1771-domain-containing protein [Poronia punctata]|nr:DUF1771-domain-containing protein [Poronia punctata]